MTQPLRLSLKFLVLASASDEEMEIILRVRDRRWSRQTKAVLARAGTDTIIDA